MSQTERVSTWGPADFYSLKQPIYVRTTFNQLTPRPPGFINLLMTNTESNATNVTATARTILRYTSQSFENIAIFGYKGGLTPGLNEAGKAELLGEVEAQAKRLAAVR